MADDSPHANARPRKDGPDQRSRKALKHIEHLASADPGKLLTTVVEELPPLVGGRGCSIYLTYNLVPEYDGMLFDGRQLLPNEDLGATPFVVLAATSRPVLQPQIGHAYYCEGEGLTGWIFKSGRPLHLSNAANRDELALIDKSLRWLDRYGGAAEYYGAQKRKPFLGVPITGPNKRVIGVLKIPAAAGQRFTPSALSIASLVAQFIGTLIVQRQDHNKSTRAMLDLAGITALAEEDVARAELLKRFSALLPFDCCRMYERQARDDRIQLKLDSRGAFPLDDPGREFGSQDGLIAWVIRTGKPLLLTDMHEFVTELTLDDKRLDNISNGPELRARDRQLRCARWEEVTARDAPLPFLAVPVVHPQQNVVLGALSASALVQPQHAHRVKPFSREDLNFATAFASAIAAVHWKARSTGISDLLTALASSTATTDLYRLTVDRLPALLHASAAHVYELTRERKLRLTHTNLVPEGGDGQAELPKIEYLLGVGKTGFAAKHRVTIVLNYFGDDALDQRELEQERARIVTEQPDDLALDALDQEGRAVGLAQVRGGARLTAEGLEQLRQLAHDSLRMTGNGIVPSKHEAHRRLGPPERWALVIAPMLGDGAVYGVLTLARSVPYERFSEADVDLVEKIAHRLGEAAHGRKLAAEREQTLAFLAHEFRTPIASMKSHLHLIQGSFPPFAQSEARRKVGESLDQLERLRILSQSIILNASGAIQECQFVERELYPVLSEACRLFRLEANDRGFDIKEPFCRGGPFPKIDMAVDWLELAFKNLLHNAVKYSLPGPVRFSRYVSVMGEFVEPERTHFSVSISNLGIGIDPEDYDNVFLPFWRSERARRTHRTGAGLGLNIVQRIVAELHGGRISVTSEPRQSGAHLTVFTVTLPVRQPAKTGRF